MVTCYLPLVSLSLYPIVPFSSISLSISSISLSISGPSLSLLVHSGSSLSLSLVSYFARLRFVWLLMILLAPVAWPISKLLDLVLGEHGGTFYRHSELKV